MVLAGLAWAGCLGDGAAVSVRWRIAERQTGRLIDPRDVANSAGVCVQSCDGSDANCPLWRVDRVRVELSDPSTGVPIPEPPAGLDATCGDRELTTPFELPEGLFAVQLRAYDPAAPLVVEAESPSPELRVLNDAEIVNLDVVELSVSPPQ